MRVELYGVHKRFRTQHVLKGIDLELGRGSRVALVGPNGSGKSTLLRIIMGMLTCEGDVKLDGRSPFEERRLIASRLAYVPQLSPQLGATVREVVRAVVDLRELETKAIVDIAHKLGLDVEAARDKPFRSLSGGMKHKLLLSMAFASDASLFILDEPTASLDAESRGRFVDMLMALPSRTTVILCSHRADEVQRFSERVVELGDGRVLRDFEVLRDEARAHAEACFAGARA